MKEYLVTYVRNYHGRKRRGELLVDALNKYAAFAEAKRILRTKQIRYDYFESAEITK